MSFISKIMKRFNVSICTFIVVFFLLAALNLNGNDLYAERAGDKDAAIITKSIRLINGRESTEIIKTKNRSGESFANAKITVTIDDPSVVTIRIKDVTDGDQVNNDENTLVAMSGMEGKKTFVIKGLREGSTAINFDILPDGADESKTIKQILTVKVIELKVDVPKQW
ncbi:MAG: hypothetical protein ACUZ8H_14925 [Candidatus Anammoxibacter sp.]